MFLMIMTVEGVDERTCGTCCRMRHLNSVAMEPVPIDEYTGRRFTFLAAPDGLPLELYGR